MTKHEITQCEIIAAKVQWYREVNNFLTSPCWLDEWCYGYFCALRDMSIISEEQWAFLCDAFSPDLKQEAV